jgi:hypothetical protein
MFFLFYVTFVNQELIRTCFSCSCSHLQYLWQSVLSFAETGTCPAAVHSLMQDQVRALSATVSVLNKFSSLQFSIPYVQNLQRMPWKQIVQFGKIM